MGGNFCVLFEKSENTRIWVRPLPAKEEQWLV
jgi:hypothetical protein